MFQTWSLHISIGFLITFLLWQENSLMTWMLVKLNGFQKKNSILCCLIPLKNYFCTNFYTYVLDIRTCIIPKRRPLARHKRRVNRFFYKNWSTFRGCWKPPVNVRRGRYLWINRGNLARFPYWGRLSLEWRWILIFKIWGLKYL